MLVGNLTRDPQVKFTQGGTAICEIDIAINNSYMNKTTNQKVEEVTYVPIVFFNRTAEVCGEYLAKGSQILVEGRLKLETWDDKETGQKRSKMKVIGESMTMLGSKNQGVGQGNQKRQPDSSQDTGNQPQSEPQSSNSPDDVPF